ncbi:MAG: hypothetical protein WC568_03260 [Candidatus Methanoperedens sp.]
MNLLKSVILIAILILIMVGIFYFIGKESSGSMMDVSVDVFLDNGGFAHISNINGTLREVNKISIPKGNEIITPGVTANVIYNQFMIGYWTSAGINPAVPLNSTTTYNLTVGLFENPKRGSDVSITVRLVGFRGEELDSIVTTFKIP